MTTPNSKQRILGISIATMLAACGGSQPPIGAPVLTQQGRLVTSVDSHIVQRAVSREVLLYAADPQDNLVYMISLPTGKLLGKLTGFDQPINDCSDAAGNVYIVDSQNHQIRAYKHGAKSAFRVLSVRGYIPTGCSVDPTTGNLAVANCCGSPNGSLAVFKDAKGSARYYFDSSYDDYETCAYDGSGDLFVNAQNAGSKRFDVVELPRGEHKFARVTLRPPVYDFPSLAWDGSSLAIASNNPPSINQYTIRGTHGVRTHTTKLSGGKPYFMFYVLSDAKSQTLYATMSENSVLSINAYTYPKGGKPLQKLYDVVDPFGITVSVAPSR